MRHRYQGEEILKGSCGEKIGVRSFRKGDYLKKSKEQVSFARELRQQHTDAERALWMKLRNREMEGVKFRRQQPIGPYIVDFVSLRRRLIIEIDGGQHNEKREKERDEERTMRLEERGYRIMRFWNNEVLTNPEGVLERIREVL